MFNSFLSAERPLEDGVLLAYVDGSLYRAEPEEAAPAGLAERLASMRDTTKPRSGEVETRAGPAQYVAVPISSGGSSGVVIAAKQLAPERDQVESAIRIALGVSIVVMLLASLFIWLAASRAIAPLHALAEATQKITETDLADRVDVRGSDELADLGRTFNGMLDRLETAFADQKEFLADVGHELRTPITVIRGHLETLGDDPAERDEATAVIQDELGADEPPRRRPADAGALRPTRLPAPRAARPRPVHARPLRQGADARRPRTGGSTRSGVGIVHADSHRLASAVMNLAQNAVKHTTPRRDDLDRQLDRRRARRGSGSATRARGSTRASRSGSSSASPTPRTRQAAGAGLGLAIVSAIAEAHGGRVELESRPAWAHASRLCCPCRRELRRGRGPVAGS